MPANLDPYLYPGTEDLRNLPGIRNAGLLAAFEANATAARLAELGARSPQGDFNLTHFAAIHRFVFQDVFDWAGEFRSVNLARGGHLFALPAFLEPALT